MELKENRTGLCKIPDDDYYRRKLKEGGVYP